MDNLILVKTFTTPKNKNKKKCNCKDDNLHGEDDDENEEEEEENNFKFKRFNNNDLQNVLDSNLNKYINNNPTGLLVYEDKSYRSMGKNNIVQTAQLAASTQLDKTNNNEIICNAPVAKETFSNYMGDIRNIKNIKEILFLIFLIFLSLFLIFF
jgi:hypothetical protein